MRRKRVRPLLRPVTGEQATGQYAVCADPDSELAASRQDLVLDSALEQGVFDLQVRDGMYGVRAACGFHATSESPMWRTWPASTSSLIAPAVSSIGTSGNTRPGR